MSLIKIGDTVKVGDKQFTPIENGVTRQKVTLEEKNFMREGIEAKIAALQADLAELQETLAEMDK